MKRSARVLLGIGKYLSLFLLLCSFFLVPAASPVRAQTSYSDSATNPDVPQDQHTRAQVVLIEGSAAIICQLIGVDIVHPEKGCLGVDQTTHKIGYSPQAGSIQVGGLLGMSSGMIGSLYQPPASGISYVAKLRDNFGIVKRTYAQTAVGQRTGFDALLPVQKLWEASRNFTYLLLVVVFVLLGMGIMLRVKIDPRTAMTIQNQVPRIIVAILLITFSYAIVGFMIDMMWLITYVGINTLSGAISVPPNCATNLTLSEDAYSNLLNIPFAYMNSLFMHKDLGDIACPNGYFYLSKNVASVIGIVINHFVIDILNAGQNCEFQNPGSWAGCILGGVVQWIAAFFGFLIAIVALLIVMFRLWFQLLKAYAYIVFYTILGPFWILLGLLPNASLSFSGWIRTLTAKLLAFPAAAMMIILARLILEAYNNQTNPSISTVGQPRDPSLHFVPPLIGNPNLTEFGPLVAFAILLITPEILNMLNDAFKAPASKYAGPAVMGGFRAGLAAGVPLGFVGKSFFRTHAGNPVGSAAVRLSNWADTEADLANGGRSIRNRLKQRVGSVGGTIIGLRPNPGGH